MGTLNSRVFSKKLGISEVALDLEQKISSLASDVN